MSSSSSSEEGELNSTWSGEGESDSDEGEGQDHQEFQFFEVKSQRNNSLLTRAGFEYTFEAPAKLFGKQM